MWYTLDLSGGAVADREYFEVTLADHGRVTLTVKIDSMKTLTFTLELREAEKLSTDMKLTVDLLKSRG